MSSKLKKVLVISGSIILGLVLLCAFFFYLGKPKPNPIWGITYSYLRAQELGFEPTELLQKMLTDLHPQKIRLPAYWAELEPQQNNFDFKLVDQLLEEAKTSNTKVVLVIGNKQPRWPECHAPLWIKSLDSAGQENATLNMIEQTVNHFKTNSAISEWQIENEPFFEYGLDCPPVDAGLFQKEVEQIKKFDNRPIISTDSGEKGVWVTTARTGIDILGATMYREVFYDKQDKFVTYPIPWWVYNIKAGLVKLLTGKSVIGVELQAEPWLKISSPWDAPIADQHAHMNPTIFNTNIEYATKVGFSENYLWGAEWWYWLQKNHNDSSMVDAAKQLFNK